MDRTYANLRNGGRVWRCERFLAFLAVGIFSAGRSSAQAIFDTHSSGVDGSPVFCQLGSEEVWDPQGLDADGDGTYEFGSITLAAGCTVRLTVEKLGPRPVTWFASGPVVIAGTLDLSGADGHGSALGSVRSPATPGPGGFAGGLGQVAGVGTITDGFGPGAGPVLGGQGSGAGYLTDGFTAYCRGCGAGAPYGNLFLLPLVGGSGGSGTAYGGGGAGGGAILIASSQSIGVNGSIRAKGGAGGGGSGGGGSGGAIRLVAPAVTGSGSLDVSGGVSFSSGDFGSSGRIRVEAVNHLFTGTATASALFVTLAPSTVLISDLVKFPTLRTVRVGGKAVPARPTGGFNPADVTINTSDPVLVEIEAQNVPEGTAVKVEVHSESVDTSTFTTTPLTGTDALRTASVLATIDAGFSLVTLRADF